MSKPKILLFRLHQPACLPHPVPIGPGVRQDKYYPVSGVWPPQLIQGGRGDFRSSEEDVDMLVDGFVWVPPGC